MSNFEEVDVQKKHIKVGKFELVEKRRFMMEARWKELERGKERQVQRLNEETKLTPT